MKSYNTSTPTIILASVFILVSFSLISFIGMRQIQKSKTEFERVINEHNRQTELITKMRDAARERMMELWRISLTKEPFARNESYEDFLSHATSYLVAREAFEQTKFSEKEKRLYQELNEATGQSASYHRKIADQFMEDVPVSVEEMLNKTLPSQKESLNALSRLLDLQAVENRQAYIMATSEVEKTVNLMLVLTASTVFIAVLLGLIIYRNNIGMRHALEQSNEQLLQSNQNLESRVAERTRQLQQANSELKRMAHYDALTGLANRSLLIEQMSILLHQAAREQKKLALLFLDLDGFKRINDEFGHDVGDRLLKVFAERISGNIRSSDLAARIGGDEFIIVLSDIHTEADAEQYAHLINSTLRVPVVSDSVELVVSVSIGISLYPDHGSDTETLIKQADIAMYQAKQDGKNLFRLFHADMRKYDPMNGENGPDRKGPV